MHAALKRPSPRRDTCSVLQIVRGRDEGSGRHVFRGFTRATPLELAVQLADDDGGGAPARIFRSYIPWLPPPLIHPPSPPPADPPPAACAPTPACVGARVLARALAHSRTSGGARARYEVL